MRSTVVSIVVAVALTGCMAAMGINLERESARAITPTPLPDSVKISDVRRGFDMARWVATTAHGVYDCSMANEEHRALCAKRDSAP